MSESMYWLVVLLLGTLILGLQSAVFLERSDALQLMRARRANSFLEEMKPGNLERECFEELCSQEEAAEIYQSKEKTMEFWYRYQSLNRCQKNPCLNGGICSAKRDSYECLCPPRYTGTNCETEVFECEYKNGGCLHYCSNSNPTSSSVTCSCANGYELESDGKSCRETAQYPCGKQWSQGSIQRSLLEELDELNHTRTSDHPNRILLNYTHPLDNATHQTSQSIHPPDNTTHPTTGESDDDTRIVGGQLQRQGGSPWQVLLYRKDDYSFCGGTLIAKHWVVTAAHCLQEKPDYVTIGDYDKLRPDEGEKMIRVEKVVIHPYYHEYTFDSDIALLYLSEPVEFSAVASPACLPNAHLAPQLLRYGERGLVTGWGATHYLGSSSRFLRKVMLPVVRQEDCIQSTEQVITDNMFCAGYLQAEMDACTGDSGGPFVVNYRGTWFLTGVVSWGERCAAEGKYGVYTRLSNFLQWIQEEMKKQEETTSKNITSTTNTEVTYP
ncbi:coagulation factor X [Electrophorus electricus]|uniref:Zmp:0000001329 n=1 Tax=Electrophorus electricus TaxID=8005 RepID=A0A4W4DMR7_ELEEL|nr:coagulation factor X [Electrophorus electricus]